MFSDSSPKIDITSGMNNLLMKKKQTEKEDMKKKLAAKREQDEAALHEKGAKTHKNIIMPVYKFNERLKMDLEEEGPPTSLYLPLGYDTKPEDKKKHYRRFFQDELENNKEIFPVMPFHTSTIHRGQSRGNKKSFFGSLFGKREETDDSGQVSTIKEVGLFKGRITIANKEQDKDFQEKLATNNKVIAELLENLHQKIFEGQSLKFRLEKLESFEGKKKFMTKLKKMGLGEEKIMEYMQQQSYSSAITRALMQRKQCLVRLYVIEGFDLASRDVGSFSDPYLQIVYGNKTISERDSYQLDCADPKFYKMYEFEANFPGASPITIQAWDYDDLFGDDLIGETSIDLDDRFFSPDWQSMKEKPVEYRELYHPSTSVN